MTMQTIEIDGKKLVLVAKEYFDDLMEKVGVLPPLPAKTPSGNYPALETCDALIARSVIKDRIERGWTQKELARRAGLRLETISRLESGKHAPTRETVTRIERALSSGAKRRAKPPRTSR